MTRELDEAKRSLDDFAAAVTSSEPADIRERRILVEGLLMLESVRKAIESAEEQGG